MKSLLQHYRDAQSQAQVRARVNRRLKLAKPLNLRSAAENDVDGQYSLPCGQLRSSACPRISWSTKNCIFFLLFSLLENINFGWFCDLVVYVLLFCVWFSVVLVFFGLLVLPPSCWEACRPSSLSDRSVFLICYPAVAARASFVHRRNSPLKQNC
ncbi:uncharacterized protein V1516DRAFT_667394 [Lipomyces oligophaga]|uniref:uncharacterized protein n=1 Tax=Lipomyces oligophaga TaxID=45792 RepID=UPI0034CF3500